VTAAIWVNGVIADTIAVADRGLQYGDGLFETIDCREGRPRFLALHLARLARGGRALAIVLPPLEQLDRELRNAAGLSREPCILKLIVTRGASARGYAPPAGAVPNRILWRIPASPAPETAPLCESLGISSMVFAQSPRLAGFKHLNRLEQVLARAELSATDDDEALMLREDGAVVSATAANLFVLRNGQLRTPLIDLAGIRGITREVVLREARVLGIEAIEARLTLADVAGAEEIFLTSSRIGVWPVARLRGIALPLPVVGLRLRQHIAALCD
jgi:4-amino-4-deoxychorismate lyase